MILNGKALAEKIQENLKNRISSLKGRKPVLGVILVGSHAPSRIYVKRKTEALSLVGMDFIRTELEESCTEIELLKEIEKFNQNEDVDGILIQLPLPPHIDTKKVINAIDPNKDVDGFHPLNLGKLIIGDESGFIPCTPLGIRTLLLDAAVSVAKKNALVIGRSTIVGKPMAALLMQNAPFGNATVTVANSQTKDLAKLAREADLLIAAIGKPQFVTEEFIKPGAIVIDVGINRLDNKLVGDVAFEEVSKKASLITPVPGGVGPMTIASLLENTFKSYLRRISLLLLFF